MLPALGLLAALAAAPHAPRAAAQGIVRAEPQGPPPAARFPIAFVPTRLGAAFVTPRGIEVGGRVVLPASGAPYAAARAPQIVAVLMAGGAPGLLVVQLPAEEGCGARHAVLDLTAGPQPAISDPVPTCTEQISARAAGSTVTLIAPALPGARNMRVWIVEGRQIRRG